MKILIIDIETTGFLNQGGKIVEVGIVELNLQTGDRKIIYDKVCHEKPITREEVEQSWIVKNSDLTLEQIQTSKDFRLLKPEIQDIINKYPLGATAFNNKFDFDFFKSRGIKFLKELPCPMKLATNVCKIPNRNGFSGYKWPNVTEAYHFLFKCCDFVEAHRGADDAFHEAEIVHELYKLGIFKLN